jgi:hypothetical protein
VRALVSAYKTTITLFAGADGVEFGFLKGLTSPAL